MANATKLPTLAELTYFQWSRKSAPGPTLAAPVSIDATDFAFSSPALDENGDVITEAFSFGIRRSDNWVEICTCPAGGLSADGKSASGVIRGINPAGIDYMAGDTDFASAHDEGEPVFCNIPAYVPSLLISALQGSIASGGASFIIGINASGTVTIKRSTGTGTNSGFLRWESVTEKVQFSNDGSTWVAIDDTVASVLAKVSTGDTTPSYLENKIVAGLGILITKLNPAGNELLSIRANGLLADIITDISVTATAINDAVNNYSLLSTYNLPIGYYPGGGVVTAGTLGDAVSASDITNNVNLVYQLPSDMKWYKVTSVETSAYRLGLVLEAGVVDASVRILLKGNYTNQSFANINPTFTSAGSGSDQNVGETTANKMVGFLIDNSTGAECTTIGGTVSAKLNGTPTADLTVALVMGNPDDTFATPACWNNANTNIQGAILATTTISRLSFSGTYADMAFTFAATKIPANAKCFLVFFTAAAASAANYYKLQVTSSGSGTLVMSEATGKAWTTIARIPKYTLTMTSTSPVGYSVKAWNGTTGKYDVKGSSLTNSWNPVIGIVLSSTTMYFDPSANRNIHRSFTFNYATTLYTFAAYALPFTPNSVHVTVGMNQPATTIRQESRRGFIGGDSANGSIFQSPRMNSGASASLHSVINDSSFQIQNQQGDANLVTSGSLQLGGVSGSMLAAIRMEAALYVYHGFTAGAGYLGDGSSQTGIYSNGLLVIN